VQLPTGLKTEACRRFAAHWHELRGGSAAAPALKEFLGQFNPTTQPHIMLIDVVSPDQLDVRLFAAGLAEKAGMDVTNMNLSVLATTPEFARSLSRSCMIVSQQRCGMWSIKRAITAGGREVTVETVSFPLSVPDGMPPVICLGIDIVDRLAVRETVLKLVSYV